MLCLESRRRQSAPTATTFSGDGMVTLFDSGGSLDDTAFAMAIEDDGTIVVGGQEKREFSSGLVPLWVKRKV